MNVRPVNVKRARIMRVSTFLALGTVKENAGTHQFGLALCIDLPIVKIGWKVTNVKMGCTTMIIIMVAVMMGFLVMVLSRDINLYHATTPKSGTLT
jgi:hypothetical protein